MGNRISNIVLLFIKYRLDMADCHVIIAFDDGTIIDEIKNAGLVQLEVSARHVHLDKECVEALFGRGYQLTHVRELSQPGQYLEQERVDVVGPKGTFKNVAVPTEAKKITMPI